MSSSDAGHKKEVYLPEGSIDEITEQAERLDRSLSWIVQTAWKIARKRILGGPATVPSPGGAKPSGEADELGLESEG